MGQAAAVVIGFIVGFIVAEIAQRYFGVRFSLNK